ncbi:hypothetical protein [Maribacter sp. IgM3_T14_3]|uniref:hypothetical protein n=1 Tax=Maribacter sp. IgM3_T14_3 TaxID=3415140 RepID=UPI003C6FF70B
MRFIVVFLFLLLFVNVFGQQKIQGRITSDGISLSNVHITNLSTNLKTFSEKDGKYLTTASPKEQLLFTHVAMDTVLILVEDVTKILNLKMNPRTEVLDEVVLTKKISRQKELAMTYFTDPTIVNTSFGYISPSSVAYHLKVIDGSEFIAGSDLLNAIAGRRAGIKVGTYFDINGVPVRSLFIRGIGSIKNQSPALFEVDGIIFNDPPVWLDISVVQRVAIISGIQAVWRYGAMGSGGVVIINTKNGIHGLREENSLKQYDQALLRNNFVSGKILNDIEKQKELPEYMKLMNSALTLEEAVGFYKRFAVQFSRSAHFYLDTYNLFYSKFGEKVADEIITLNFDSFEKNPVWLKALAFYYEEQKRFEMAHDIYEKIYVLRPDYAQSYIDLSNSYRNLNKPESSIAFLARYQYLSENGYFQEESEAFNSIIKKETDNLVFSNNFYSGSKTNKEEFNTRLIFEWNDSEAEFNLQFVNPNNQFFNWSHTLENASDRIMDEKKLGFSMADFMLDDSLQGLWQVNGTYFGNKQLSPSFLKATIYRNYNTKQQTKETKVYRLDIIGANQQILRFNLSNQIVKNQ